MWLSLYCPTVFHVFLPQSCSDPRGPPLPPGSKLELPLWMAAALTRRARLTSSLEVSLPPIYTFSKRAGQMKADPVALELPR